MHQTHRDECLRGASVAGSVSSVRPSRIAGAMRGDYSGSLFSSDGGTGIRTRSWIVVVARLEKGDPVVLDVIDQPVLLGDSP